jgi:hypothetical protein
MQPPALRGQHQHNGSMSALKRLSMAGSDVAVTDATIADLVLEYAMHLGRAGTTEIVAIPAPGGSGDIEVDLLLGPASQIVLSDSDEPGTIDPARAHDVADELRARIERLTGRSASEIAGDPDADPLAAFVDFDEFPEPR